MATRRVTDDKMRSALAGAGMSARQTEAIVQMSIGLRDGFVPEQSRDATTTTTPTTLTAWCYDVLWFLIAGGQGTPRH